MKKSIILISILLLVCFLPINTFGECIKGDCVNGQGSYIDPDGYKYDGEFKNGKPHGEGTFTFPNGAKYIGEFKDGKYHGQGEYTYTDGRKLTGRFKNHEFFGK